jgi:hypothetical protein
LRNALFSEVKMKKKKYINIVLNGESIGSYGKVLNASISNTNMKPRKKIFSFFYNVAFVALIYVCLREMIFFR